MWMVGCQIPRKQWANLAHKPIFCRGQNAFLFSNYLNINNINLHRLTQKKWNLFSLLKCFGPQYGFHFWVLVSGTKKIRKILRSLFQSHFCTISNRVWILCVQKNLTSPTYMYIFSAKFPFFRCSRPL